MQTTQDAPAEILFKLWPWLEANRNRIIGVAAAIALVIGAYYFMVARGEANEQAAGTALTDLLMTPPTGVNPAEALAALAKNYPGTKAAQRAQLQAGSAFFGAERFSDAAATFQKYLDDNPDGSLAATAQLGLGASLEAEGQLDAAAAVYEKVVNMYAGSLSALPAFCGLGRIDEAQGKLREAADNYESAARAGNIGGSVAKEAAVQAAQIQAELAASQPAASKPAAPASFP